jgi:hypothetical protein
MDYLRRQKAIGPNARPAIEMRLQVLRAAWVLLDRVPERRNRGWYVGAVFEYEIVMKEDGLAISGFERVYESRPPQRGAGFTITAYPSRDLIHDRDYLKYDAAVSMPCQVFRTREGLREECTGSLAEIGPPVIVRLDGRGWQSMPG